jgi:hypothetical protein
MLDRVLMNGQREARTRNQRIKSPIIDDSMRELQRFENNVTPILSLFVLNNTSIEYR